MGRYSPGSDSSSPRNTGQVPVASMVVPELGLLTKFIYSGSGVRGSGLGVWGLGLWVLGFRVKFRVWSLG